MTEDIIRRIEDCKIIAMLRGVKGERIVPLTKALSAGGIDCVEVCFDPSGMQSDYDIASELSMLTSYFGDEICVGAGNVRTVEQVEIAAKAGVDFIISVCTNPEVMRKAAERGLVRIPGAFTPTEIDAAQNAGADFVMLCPASFFGTEYMDEIMPHFSDVRMMAGGGVNVWNMRAFLDAGCSAVEVGGKLVENVYLPRCDYGVIEETAKAYRAIADNDRRPVNRELR